MGIRVLIVDDSSTIRKIISRCLQAGELDVTEVCEAGNGQEALDALSRLRVNVVLADINMPKMDGLQLLAEIRQNRAWHDIPVLMITSESSAVSVREAINRGAAGYIRKPFTSSEIRSQLMPVLKIVPAHDLN
jgi:two-component system chemotaxis response regulator CheY